jgi:putative transcriptional regulator
MKGMTGQNPADSRGQDGVSPEGSGRGDARPGRAGKAEAGHGDVAAGMLLVATPELQDPNFQRTVVYVLAHGEDGSVGLVINRRTETAVHNVLPNWSEQTVKPRALYSGGPVQMTGAMCLGVPRLGVSPAEINGVVGIAGSVVLVDLDADPALVGAQLRGVRIFAGHAGWGEGQLEAEISDGAWYVVSSRADDVLVGPDADLWFRVMKRQGFPLAWQAYTPKDPSAN